MTHLSPSPSSLKSANMAFLGSMQGLDLGPPIDPWNAALIDQFVLAIDTVTNEPSRTLEKQGGVHGL